MKFLLVGGDGYIGRVLQEEIIKAGHDYHVMDSNLLGLTKESDKITIADTVKDKELIDSYEDYDVLVNMAAVVGDPACLVDTRFSLQNNCVGTRNMVEKANKDNIKIIHFSTCSLYGAEHCTPDNPLTEDSSTFPIDFYGQTKYQQERFVTELANDYCVFRLGTAYGQSPRMRYDLVIPTFTAMAANNDKLTVFGGNQWRPFVHIRDVARAVIFAAEENLDGIYNLTNENLTILDVAEKISLVLGYDNYEVNKGVEDPRNYIASGQKLINAGFEFEEFVEKGIIEMAIADTVGEYKKVKYDNAKIARLKQMGYEI